MNRKIKLRLIIALAWILWIEFLIWASVNKWEFHSFGDWQWLIGWLTTGVVLLYCTTKDTP